MLSKEEIIKIYQTEKLTSKQIYEQYGIPPATFYRLLKRYGIDRYRHIAPTKEELYDLYINKDMTMEEIGDYYKRTRKSIARFLKKFNIVKEYLSKDEILKAYNSCSTYREMAELLNSTPSTCSLYCQKYGLKYNTKVEDKFDDNFINKIKTMSEIEHLSLRTISKKLNINRFTIRRIMKCNNIKCLSDLGLSASNPNISKETWDLLNNKDALSKIITDNKIASANQLANYLKISSGLSCKFCSKHDIYNLFNYQSSVEEQEISFYIKQYFNIITHDKTLLNGKEIDIFIPELKLGIEFNGDYWHNDKFLNKTYHQDKSKLSDSKGVFIYHIFEYEWATKREQILNQLNNLLHINQEKIYARKCEIKTVSDYDKQEFLSNNHLQGNDASSVKLGLYYNDKLVSLMTFCKPRFNKNYEWELSRFCSLAGCNVVGGASKLFKYFIKTYNPNSIISYSNYAHTRGNLYQMLGFEFKELSSPNYIWIKNKSILSRYQCQKHKLLEQGFTGSSELEIMRNRGYSRIFDCGNKVWIWNKTN